MGVLQEVVPVHLGRHNGVDRPGVCVVIFPFRLLLFVVIIKLLTYALPALFGSSFRRLYAVISSLFIPPSLLLRLVLSKRIV
jgi:hypothetical protein